MRVIENGFSNPKTENPAHSGMHIQRESIVAGHYIW